MPFFPQVISKLAPQAFNNDNNGMVSSAPSTLLSPVVHKEIKEPSPDSPEVHFASDSVHAEGSVFAEQQRMRGILESCMQVRVLLCSQRDALPLGDNV